MQPASESCFAAAGGSYAEAAQRTLFELNNETLNAWTTLSGLLFITCLYAYSMCGLLLTARRVPAVSRSAGWNDCAALARCAACQA